MRSNQFDSKREINDVLTILDMTYLSQRTQALPMQAWLRIATACDLSCPLCERQHITPVDSGFMKLDLFRDMVRQMAGVQKIHLFGLGEPFLNKNFFEYVTECHQQGIEVSTTTHAMHLSDQLAARIIEYGMEEIAISIDAAEPELFNRLREGAVFEVVCENVQRLVDLRKQKDSTLPRLQICCTVSTENANQFLPMVELAHRLGVERIFFSDVTAPTPEHVHFCLGDTPQIRERFEQAKKRGQELGLEVEYFRQNSRPWERKPPKIITHPHGCSMAWTNLVVERLGDTKICCYIKDSLPSAFGLPIEQAMNSEGHQQIRKQLMEGIIRAECQECPNLVRNTPELVSITLKEAINRVEHSSLTQSEKQYLLYQVKEFHGLATAKFGSKLFPQDSKSRFQKIKQLVPSPVKRLLRKTLIRSQVL